jgi:hypothetical protein
MGRLQDVPKQTPSPKPVACPRCRRRDVPIVWGVNPYVRVVMGHITWDWRCKPCRDKAEDELVTRPVKSNNERTT